jgi:4-diphosphocytidyl-2-C-methyl-D-erythritol kinase
VPRAPLPTIGLAAPHHVEALAAVELAAATMLVGYAPAEILAGTLPVEQLHEAQRAGRLWVALHEDIPIGFAAVGMIADDEPHLRELDVVPAHGRRGIGTALLKAALVWLDESDCLQITLTTFRDVPWNQPFYARHGFEVLSPEAMPPALAAVFASEIARGLDPMNRVAMRYRRRSRV